MKSLKITNNKFAQFMPLLLVAVLMVLFGIVLVIKPTQQVQAQTDSFSFGASADYSSTSNTDAVLTTVKNSGLSFQIAVGDFSYDTQGSPAGWGTYVKNIIGNLPFVLIQGNHDASQIDQFVAALPDPMGSQGTYGKQFYFDYPASSPIARFIMISPAHMSVDTNWLNTAIDSAKSSGIQWVIAGMHEPCITAGKKTECESTEAIMNQLLTKKVDVILYGHEHNYQRSKQLKCAKKGSFDASCVAAEGNAFTQGAGSVMAVVGMGGNGFYNVSTSDSEAGYFAAMNSDTYGILKFTVSKSQLAAQFVKSAGGSFSDSFTISASITAPSGAVSGSPSTAPSAAPSGTQSITYYPLAPCPTCSGPSYSPAPSGGVYITGTAQYPSGTINNPDTEDPCDAEGAAIAHDKKKHKHKHKHKKHHGGMSDGIEAIIKFLIELLNKLIELLGGKPIQDPYPDENQNPEEPEQPEEPDPCVPSGTPSTTPSSAPEPSITTTQSPNPSQPASSQAPSTGPSPSQPLSSGTQASVKITFYGSYDNDPPGSKSIANPVKHQEAGGTGTFADPLTFASPAGAGEYHFGTIIYVPLVQKYFVREDVCAVSQTAPNGCGDVSMVDLYVGNPSDSAAVESCQNSLTPSGNTTIYVNPPGNLPVDSKPIWNQVTGECMQPH